MTPLRRIIALWVKIKRFELFVRGVYAKNILQTLLPRATHKKTLFDTLSVNGYTDQIGELEATVKTQRETIKTLTTKVENLENYKRSHNLIIEGVTETANENVRAAIDKLFEDLELDFGAEWCDLIYRMGPKKQTMHRPRPIFVSFPYTRLKRLVLRNAYKLKNMQERKYTYLSDDLTPDQQSQRRDLRCLNAYARSMQIDSKLRGNAIIIDGTRYTHADIGKLPHEITFENAKILEVQDGHAFQSEHAFLSSLFDCEFTYNNQKYYSSEQALHHIRADENNQPELAADILKTKSSILKDALITLISEFKFILNLSFAQGNFPDKWKLAQITPLPKEGDPTVCNNYRPISLLPLPGKIAERIVHTRLITYFETNSFLNKNQGGFRKNNSTINSISEFTHEIFTAINDSNTSLATFIDFSKAFDTVNHFILIEKLKKYGIVNSNLAWLQNYLLNRKQCTTVNGTTSDLLNISCGVPQGSILGPILFSIYINDLSHVVTNTSMYLYADDTVLLSSDKNILSARTKMQLDLIEIATWCWRNKLSLNIKKKKMHAVWFQSSSEKHKMSQIINK